MTKSIKHRIVPVAVLCALACLFWLAVACGGDEPEAANAPDYEATVAAALAAVEASAPTDEPPPTVEPAPTPTEVPPSPTPTAPAANTPETTTAGNSEPLAPLVINDPNAFVADLSEPERTCLSGTIGPERLTVLLRSPELSDEADRSAVLGCLEQDTLLRLFLTHVLSATGPLSPESSECLRRSYAETDLNALMFAAASPSDPGSPGESAEVAAMVAFMVSLSCLNEEEFQVAAPALGMAPGEYEGFQCALEKVGGQDAMTALLAPAAGFPVALFEAAAECQVQLGGPPPG